nr:probable ATP-dependent RNA helicase spindle-E [Danaus plexippus plexippus]
MPNIRGLPAIIALLFCPEAELRRDSTATRYVSVLCGLGSDEVGRPRFPEHDLLVDVDADLSVEDIGLVGYTHSHTRSHTHIRRIVYVTYRDINIYIQMACIILVTELTNNDYVCFI